jgi:hypothetical protein
MNRLMESALVGFLVNLCATNLVAALDNVDRRLFSALELAQDFVYQAVFDEWFDSFWDFHWSEVPG